MYTLYTRAGSGGFVAEAALSMSGAPFKTVEVERGSTDPAFRGISPLNQVPVLTLPDGRSITESAAICILIADLYPAAGLSPAADSSDRPEFLRWMLFMSSVLYPVLLRVFYAHRYSASPAGLEEVKAIALDGDRPRLRDHGTRRCRIATGWSATASRSPTSICSCSAAGIR